MGALYGSTYYLSLFSWTFDGSSSPLSALGGVVVAVIESWPYVVVAIVASLSAGRGLLTRSLLTATFWSIGEQVRTLGAWGMPYGDIGATQSASSLALGAPVVGVAGLSFLLVLACALIALSIPNSSFRAPPHRVAITVACSALVAVTWPFGPRAALGRPVRDGSNVAIVQTSRLEGFDVDRTLYGLEESLERLNRRVDLVVLPEAAIPDEGVGRETFRRIAREFRAAVVYGAIVQRDGRIYNSAVEIQGDGSSLRYDKRELVPFGEYIPLRPVFSRFVTGMPEMTSGTRNGLSRFASDMMSILICYEAAFSRFTLEAAQLGASFIVVPVNDDWFRGQAGKNLQAEVLSLRSRESGLSIVAASTRSSSAVYYPDGEIRGVPQGYAVTIERIPRPRRTFFSRYHTNLKKLAVFFIVSLFAIKAASYRLVAKSITAHGDGRS